MLEYAFGDERILTETGVIEHTRAKRDQKIHHVNVNVSSNANHPQVIPLYRHLDLKKTHPYMHLIIHTHIYAHTHIRHSNFGNNENYTRFMLARVGV